ncbi:hypothetical protein FIM1_3617 [Kluyveromyces marxianus]|uniref:Uncharacterized protein n=2 Tax=Kluyveromyces marxianus TaxID=4911 RepID=W0TCM5_KLUMD|nr:hypothetical protein KLMA_50521 [Kluyveromyces marxianus DMKU3-1042]QGN16890.1 hypothetical protein FIM1_3617 [Kluyveromyces marxianus]BAO41175.1 hypothetical protein KLMA_50521 [Kluyveromyces marxianus DMKU3-1042]
MDITLKRSSSRVTSTADSVKDTQTSENLQQLIQKSLALQNEIQQLFSEYEANNKDIRDDVDDFCEIYESSIGNLTVG